MRTFLFQTIQYLAKLWHNISNSWYKKKKFSFIDEISTWDIYTKPTMKNTKWKHGFTVTSYTVQISAVNMTTTCFPTCWIGKQNGSFNVFNIQIKTKWHNIKLGHTWICVKFCKPTKGRLHHAEHTNVKTEHWRIVKTPYTDEACADIDITSIVYLEEEVSYLYYGLWRETEDYRYCTVCYH